ncbi:MAG: serine/threonine-protein kinase [Hyphomicrobiaceae bacterium]
MTNLLALAPGTTLVGDYRIERVLGAGGFGITYLAEEIALARRVTIKEYFPSDFAARETGSSVACPRSRDSSEDYEWGLERFIDEAQALAKFDHPHIVRVYRYFRANKTAYMVLHFEEGQSLKMWLKSLARAPRQSELDAIIAPLLDALEIIHKAEFLHRDIAPDNIMIRRDDSPVLIDFGSARAAIANHSKTVSALVKPGYSPFEQYAATGRQQGPWTDIYSLGATLYQAVTGRRPSDSPSRMASDDYVPVRELALSSYRAGFLAAVDHSLKLSIDQRPRSVAAWRQELFAEPTRRRTPAAAPVVENLKEAAAAQTPEPAARALSQRPRRGIRQLIEGFQARSLRQPEAQPAAQPAMAEAAAVAGAGGAGMAAAPGRGAEMAAAAPRTPSEAAAQPMLAPAAALPVPAKPKIFPQPVPRKPPPRPLSGRHSSGGVRRLRPFLVYTLLLIGLSAGAVAVVDWGNKSPPEVAGKHGLSQPSSQTTPVALASEIKGHKGLAGAVRFSSDGRSLVTVGADATLKIWNATTGGLIRTIELDDGPATTLSVKGARAATGHGDGAIVLWDLESGQRIARFKRNGANIWSVAFAGRADRVAVASHDWTVTLWDTRSLSTPAHVFEGHQNAAQSVAFSERGHLIASGGADKLVKLWNADDLSLVRTYRGHRDFVTALAFSRDGRLLASASLDGGLRLWSTSSGRLYRSLRGYRGKISAIALSPATGLLAAACGDGVVRVWDIRRGRIIRRLEGHTGAVTSVAFSPDGQRLASSGEDGTLRLWRTAGLRRSGRD